MRVWGLSEFGTIVHQPEVPRLPFKNMPFARVEKTLTGIAMRLARTNRH